jgi:hypothetical protein
MHRPFRTRLAVAFAALGFVTASAPAVASQTPVLKMPAPSALNGRSYGIEFSNVVSFTGRDGAEMNRTVRFHVTLNAAAGGRGLSVRMDSARGSASNPHARSVLDLRSFVGTSLGVTYADSGKPVKWETAGPTVDFADASGALALSLLLDPMFPALPARDVRAGTTWERTWSRTALVGQQAHTTAVRTRYTVDKTERVGGVTGWRVSFVTTPVAGAAHVDQSGGSMLVGADGVLHELTLEETTSGRWEFNGEQLPYTQREQVRVALRPGSRR